LEIPSSRNSPNSKKSTSAKRRKRRKGSKSKTPLNIRRRRKRKKRSLSKRKKSRRGHDYEEESPRFEVGESSYEDVFSSERREEGIERLIYESLNKLNPIERKKKIQQFVDQLGDEKSRGGEKKEQKKVQEVDQDRVIVNGKAYVSETLYKKMKKEKKSETEKQAKLNQKAEQIVLTFEQMEQDYKNETPEIDQYEPESKVVVKGPFKRVEDPESRSVHKSKKKSKNPKMKARSASRKKFKKRAKRVSNNNEQDFYSKYEVLTNYQPIIKDLKLPKVYFAFRPKTWSHGKKIDD
jgi:hypothetical protein